MLEYVESSISMILLKTKMQSRNVLILTILLTSCLMGVSSDIYAPSLSMIATDLKTPIDMVQWSMAIFMLGVSLSQLIYGPVSEVVGRRLPLIIGLGIMLIGSIVCFYTTNITVLIVSRFVQGLGAGAGACMWRSIFRDSFDSTQMAKYGSFLSIIMIFVVAAAPALGGCLQGYFGWRSSFLFLILYSLLTIIIVLFLFKETSLHHHRDRFNRQFFLHAFGQLISSRTFMGYTLCTFLTYGAFFSWFAIGPVLLIEDIGLNPITFGWITLFGGGTSMALGGVFNGIMIGRFGMHFMLRLGWFIMIIAGSLMILFKLIYGITTFAIVAPMILFYFGVTLIWPSAFAGAFAPFGKIAGYAGALYSFMQIGGAAVIGSLGSFLPTTSQIPLATIFLVASALAWIAFEKIVLGDVRPQQNQTADQG